jgi:sugar/nucleoside kinase (ribokinase family)
VDLVSESSERFAQVVRPALPFVDYLFLNEFEISQVTGITTVRDGQVDWHAIERAAEELIRDGLRGWAFVHFPAAVYGCSADGRRIWQPALSVPGEHVRGVAGAGDALASGILYGLHEGWPMEKSLQLGVCTAAASLSHPTCSEGIRSADECCELAGRFGYLGVPLRVVGQAS